jgi:AmmeMemoRadiSam system protein A
MTPDLSKHSVSQPLAPEPVDSVLLQIARSAIAARLSGARFTPPASRLLPLPYGVFVTLWTPEHALRGCVGQLGPIENLPATVAECAVSAAVNDARFAPVTNIDLPHLDIEISLLEPPQRVSDLDELDPTSYGVIVQQNGRRGVLLPGVAGVERPEDQVAIACRKGFIDPMQRFDIARFRVRELRE